MITSIANATYNIISSYLTKKLVALMLMKKKRACHLLYILRMFFLMSPGQNKWFTCTNVIPSLHLSCQKIHRARPFEILFLTSWKWLVALMSKITKGFWSLSIRVHEEFFSRSPPTKKNKISIHPSSLCRLVQTSTD